MADIEGAIELRDLRRVLEGRAAPRFEDPDAGSKTMWVALDIGPADIRIRRNRFTVRWKGRGASTYYPRLAPPMTADLMRRAGLATVTTATVAWMPSAIIEGRSDTITPPSYVIWFVPLEDGLDIFTRAAPAEGPPAEPGPIPAQGPYALPTPWSSAHWHEYREFTRGLACPHCAATSNRYRAARAGALVCAACGRSFDV